MCVVAILGASGAVGQEMLRTLEQRGFPCREVRLLASPRSAGRTFPYRSRLLTVEAVTPEAFEGVDIALFSAGGSVSKQWAPIAAERGALVIDNSSAFRMEDDVPLVVPECNAHTLEVRPPRGIIANPNCSTIQMVVALKPLHEKFVVKRLVISTYQAVSGKGGRAIEELQEQTAAILDGDPDFLIQEFPHQIAFNALPHIDVFQPNGYTKEEMKMVHETRKILEAPDILASATCVRIPVIRGHSESITVEFGEKVTPEQVRETLEGKPGVVVVDEPESNQYPQPLYSDGRDETYVGRIRQDISDPSGKSIVLWVVSDNLRKGAALNAVQIAEWLVQHGKLEKATV